MINRQDLINSICEMYNEWMQVESVPEEIMKTINNSSTIGLIDTLELWKVKHPEIYAKYGVCAI